jgi:hypothetical protein
MWNEHTHLSDRRVLALVGGAPVGRRLLRGVRHRGDRVPLHALGLIPVNRHVAVLFATIVFMAGGVLGHLAPSLLHRHADAGAGAGRELLALEVVPLAYIGFEAYHSGGSQGHAVDAALQAGRSCSSSPSASGTWWAPACSAS